MQLMTKGYDLFIARNIHEQFSRKPGSHLIASVFSLCHLSRLIRLRRPRMVLEIGAGIGTISQLILLHHEGVESLCSIESDAFCRTALRENVTSQEGQRWSLFSSHTDIPRNLAFDMIVFDGTQYDDSTLKFMRTETAVFVDGMRRRTRNELVSHCAQHGLSLRLHEYKGDWRIRMRGLNTPKAVPNLVFRRERCHLGVCRAAPVVASVRQHGRYDSRRLHAGVETA